MLPLLFVNREEVSSRAISPASSGRRCASCSRRLRKGKRSHAVYCSGRCRNRAYYGRKKASEASEFFQGIEESPAPAKPAKPPRIPAPSGTRSKGPRRGRRRELRALRERLARAYVLAVGLEGALEWQRSWKGRLGLKEWSGWSAYPDVRAAELGLFGKTGVHLGQVKTLRVVTLDVDAHMGWREEQDAVDAEREGNQKLSRAGAVRRIVARRAWRLVEDIRARFGKSAFVETSERGIHVSFFLAKTVRTHRAEEVGRWILSEIGRREGAQEGEGISIEVFPKAGKRRGADGRSCRLPLTGGARVLGPDLSTPHFRGRSRTLDVQELLLTPKLSIDGAWFDEEESPDAGAIDAGTEDPQSSEAISSYAEDDETAREMCGRVVKGDRFASICRYLVERGIPDDASFGAASKIAALLLYFGAGEREACSAWDLFVAEGSHRSTRANSRKGQRALSATFRWWFVKGLRSERVRPGRLRRRDLRELAEGLLFSGSEALRAA